MTVISKNKLVYFGETLFDTSSATAEPADVRSGQTFVDKDGVMQTGTSTKDSDTSTDTAQASEILATKTAHARGSQLTGTMQNRGAIAEVIDDKNDVIVVPVGFHDGSGTVQLDATEKAKIADPSNIKQGVTILGTTGTCAPASGVTAQSKNATPSNAQQTILPDNGVDYLSQVVIAAVPYAETPTAGTNGYTITIG